MIKNYKKAFTLVELIFVIVIIGIIGAVASSTFKTNYLAQDASFMLAKIKQTQYKGVGLDHRNFDGTIIADTTGCIDLNQDILNESSVNGDITYKGHVDNFDYGTVCFDVKGRPHDSTHNGNLSGQKNIVLTYNGETKTILILPISGLAIIKCN